MSVGSLQSAMRPGKRSAVWWPLFSVDLGLISRSIGRFPQRQYEINTQVDAACSYQRAASRSNLMQHLQEDARRTVLRCQKSMAGKANASVPGAFESNVLSCRRLHHKPGSTRRRSTSGERQQRRRLTAVPKSYPNQLLPIARYAGLISTIEWFLSRRLIRSIPNPSNARTVAMCSEGSGTGVA